MKALQAAFGTSWLVLLALLSSCGAPNQQLPAQPGQPLACAASGALSAEQLGACLEFGAGLWSPQGLIIKDQAERAQRLQALELSCEAKSKQACELLGRYHQSQGAAEGAFIAHLRACELDSGTGCLVAGEYLAAQEDARTPAFFRRASELGEARGLARLGLWAVEHEGDTQIALALYDEACQSQDPLGCTLWAEALLQQERLEPEALWLGCDGGQGKACYLLGELYLDNAFGDTPAKDLSLAYGIFSYGCEQGSGPACAQQAWMLYRGEGRDYQGGKALTLIATADERLALEQALGACELDSGEGCTLAAIMLSGGSQHLPDLAQAAQLYTKGCNLSPARCVEAAEFELRFGDFEQAISALELLLDDPTTTAAAAIVMGDFLLHEGEDPSAFYKIACEAGFEEACAYVANFSSEEAVVAHCRLGDGRACQLLAYIFEVHDLLTSPKAEALALRNCFLGEVKSCYRYGQAKLQQTPPAQSRARQALLHGCAQGHGRSCTALAQLCSQQDLLRDIQLSNRAWARACALGEEEACEVVVYEDTEAQIQALAAACDDADAQACGDLSQVLRDEARGPRDLDVFLEMADRGCELGDDWACVNAAEGHGFFDGAAQPALERIYNDCLGAPGRDICAAAAQAYNDEALSFYDPERAQELSLLSCEAGIPEACLAMGAATFTALGEAETVRIAITKACDEGLATACVILYFMASDEDEKAAQELLYDSCYLGNTFGCGALATLLFDFNGTGETDADARILADFGCRIGDAKACVILSDMCLLGRAGPVDSACAMNAAVAACALDEAKGCYQSGAIFSDGQGFNDDSQLASRYYLLACDAGIGLACFELGELHEQGPDELRDGAMARSRFQQACELGIEQACERLESP